MTPIIVDSSARSVETHLDVPCLFIVENEPLERILFDRNLIGLPFRHACFEASRLFVRHIADELSEQAAELVILGKGLLYQLVDAVAVEASLNLAMNLIAITRLDVASSDATVEVSYRSLDAGGHILLVGDTVASGATIVAAFEEYMKVHELRRVYLFSYAGALTGAHRISKFCDRNGIALTMLFGLAAFGLGDNGFDLSFLHPSTITDDKYRRRAAQQFGNQPASSVGWDFGSQAMAPTKYRELCWIEAEVWGLHGAPCFAVEQRPDDLRRVARETPAYSSIMSRLPSDSSA